MRGVLCDGRDHCHGRRAGTDHCNAFVLVIQILWPHLRVKHRSFKVFFAFKGRTIRLVVAVVAGAHQKHVAADRFPFLLATG